MGCNARMKEINAQGYKSFYLWSGLDFIFITLHFVLSLGAVIAIFSGIIFNGEKIVGSKNLLPSSSSRNSSIQLILHFLVNHWTFILSSQNGAGMVIFVQ